MTSSWIQGQHPRLGFVPFLFGLWAARIQSRARQTSNLLSLETCSFELRKHLKAPGPTGIPQVLGHALHPTFNRVIPWPIKDTNFFFKITDNAMTSRLYLSPASREPQATALSSLQKWYPIDSLPRLYFLPEIMVCLSFILLEKKKGEVNIPPYFTILLGYSRLLNTRGQSLALILESLKGHHAGDTYRLLMSQRSP